MWQQKRILEIIKHVISKGYNYCHHHSPAWENDKKDQKAIPVDKIAGPGGDVGVCSAAGITGDKGWKGIDCTHYTSYGYNFGLGSHLVSLTGDQACGPNAPGKALPYTANDVDKLLPGDLLYIAANSKSNPLKVSHGIFWTGIKVTYDNGPFSFDTLLKNVPANQQAAVKKDVEDLKSKKKDVYVISDSHNAGPNYRIFAGWWKSAFTHARRLINPDSTLPLNPKNASFDGKVCNVKKVVKSRRFR